MIQVNHPHSSVFLHHKPLFPCILKFIAQLRFLLLLAAVEKFFYKTPLINLATLKHLPELDNRVLVCRLKALLEKCD